MKGSHARRHCRITRALKLCVWAKTGYKGEVHKEKHAKPPTPLLGGGTGVSEYPL